MFFHVLAHVQADDGLFVVKQECREGFGEFGLADAGGAQEDKTADGAVRILKSRARTPYGRRNRLDRLILPDDASGEVFLDGEDFFDLVFHHFGDGNAGPCRHGVGDFVGPDRRFDETRLAVETRFERLEV